jgi:hypothetical protein
MQMGVDVARPMVEAWHRYEHGFYHLILETVERTAAEFSTVARKWEADRTSQTQEAVANTTEHSPDGINSSPHNNVQQPYQPSGYFEFAGEVMRSVLESGLSYEVSIHSAFVPKSMTSMNIPIEFKLENRLDEAVDVHGVFIVLRDSVDIDRISYAFDPPLQPGRAVAFRRIITVRGLDRYHLVTDQFEMGRLIISLIGSDDRVLLDAMQRLHLAVTNIELNVNRSSATGT